VSDAAGRHNPGTVVRADKGGIFVGCHGGVVEIFRGQMEGRRPMSGQDLANGLAVRLGDVLGT